MAFANPWLGFALNNAYANRTLYTAMEGMSAEDFTAPRPGFFGSLDQTLDHIYAVDLYYLDALEGGGQGLGVFDRAPMSSRETLASRQAEADMRFAMFCRNLTDADLAREIDTDRPGGRVTETVGAILPHLVQHQIHHRGQAHVQLSHAGITPPQLDEFFLNYDRAELAKAYFG
ncbi:DinB family protein [Maritimibacter sp. DP1N21-5]|uniref:DinB family protein n=1 Tax=Maritimibacter sp. DP1N21-5 TaxID=2836867 RepID=UPI001C452320|nr:DinB family protein [Maritimibacter sp. DP1N21-5]MBV7409297.1 DinB family protein [Maritimibacter sp. DP1N21-5]